MNFKKTLMAGAMALSLTATAAVAAQERGHGRHGGFARHMFGHAVGALNLTDQQKEFAKQLATDTRKQAEPVANELKENRQAMSAAVKANNTAEIDRISQRQGILTGQLSALHSKAMASFYAQLTPEQKAKADEVRNRAKERFSHRGQHRPAQHQANQ